ncbi:MAG TPA: RNA polymerase sigma factor RpoE [Nevskia sp.]|nr:RNA polymerase sigma factor RpoE [Nevskia sp.]
MAATARLKQHNEHPARAHKPEWAATGPAARPPQNPSEAANDSSIGAERDIDEQLVARAQAGDEMAFELLVRKYQQKAIQLVSRLVGEADAPDVAQEAFIKAYRALSGFRGQSAFYTWLYRIAINSAKNHLVSRARRPAGQDIDIADAELYGHTGQLSDLDTPESTLLAQEIKDKVTSVISKLPSDLRQAIVLRELDGLSYEEIAEAMRCPIGTVRSRIFRARESIDAVVQPLLDA